jgi:hypothetical protein
MDTNFNGGSAKIYQFPEGGRASMSRQSARAQATANFGSQIVSEATYGSWYHDEAIRESQQPKMAPKKAQPNAVIVPLTFPRH